MTSNTVYLPIQNLTTSSNLQFKIFNYSEVKALNAEIISAKNNYNQLEVSVESTPIKNIAPKNTPNYNNFKIMPFRVEVLYTNTPVSIELLLENVDFVED